MLFLNKRYRLLISGLLLNLLLGACAQNTSTSDPIVLESPDVGRLAGHTERVKVSLIFYDESGLIERAKCSLKWTDDSRITGSCPKLAPGIYHYKLEYREQGRTSLLLAKAESTVDIGKDNNVLIAPVLDFDISVKNGKSNLDVFIARVTPQVSPTITISTIDGLVGEGLLLQNNGGDDLVIANNPPYTFNTSLAESNTYQVTVKNQPTNPLQTCTVNNSQGTVGTQDILLSINCQTKDVAGPSVVAVFPGRNKQNVDINLNNINVTFDSALAVASVNADTFKVLKPDGSAVAGTVSYELASKTATFTLTSSLLANTQYTMTLSTDIVDTNGEALATEYKAQFTTQLPSLTISDVSVNEGIGFAELQLSLDVISGSPVTVDYATTSDTATEGQDFIKANGTLTFAPGETSQTLSIDIIDDNIPENDEQLLVTLSNSDNASIVDGEAIVLIQNNDTLAAPALSVIDGGGRITLNWADVPSATSYNVYYAEQSGISPDNYNAIGGTLLSNQSSGLVLTDLEPWKNYYFAITAITGSFESSPSAEKSVRLRPLTITSGSSHSCVIQSDGTLWCWGNNRNGQLGDGTTENKSTPTAIGAVIDWVQISLGTDHSCGIKTDGSLWCWGYNEIGQLGTSDKTIPIQIGTDTDWTQISLGSSHSCGLKTDGRLWCWGWNRDGQLGDGPTLNKTIPTAIGTSTDWNQISIKGNHSCGLKTDGSLWCWGYNGQGQLGDGATLNKTIPTAIGTSTDWKQISIGRDLFSAHSCGLKTGGSLWCWGHNGKGQLGDGTLLRKRIPTVIDTTHWAQISLGTDSSCGVKINGSLWCWGKNLWGQLGDGTTSRKSIPTTIGIATDWAQISLGGIHSCGLKTNGSLWCWGNNRNGQLGDGTTESKSIPIAIGAATDWVQISLGGGHSCGIKTDDSLWCWGNNNNGQLGDGTTESKSIPTAIGAATDWAKISLASSDSCGIKADDSLWCWGNNKNSQLGDGTTSDKTIPTIIGTTRDWSQMSSGRGSHRCGLKTDGSLWCWGDNSYGQLGDGDAWKDIPQLVVIP